MFIDVVVSNYVPLHLFRFVISRVSLICLLIDIVRKKKKDDDDEKDEDDEEDNFVL